MKAPLESFGGALPPLHGTAVLSQQSLTPSAKEWFLSTHWKRVLPMLEVKVYFRPMFYLLAPCSRKACPHMAGTHRGKKKNQCTHCSIIPILSSLTFLEFIAILFINLQFRNNLVLDWRGVFFFVQRIHLLSFPHSSMEHRRQEQKFVKYT